MRRPTANLLLCLCLAISPQLALSADDPPAPTLVAAQHLLLTGKYAEATEAYQALVKTEPVSAAVGLARCQQSQGQREAAEANLSQAAAAHPNAPDLYAERAALAFERGDHAAARQYVEAALKGAPDSLAAHWWQAELHRTVGEIDEAQAAYKWLVDYYNQHEEFSPDDLRWIGLGAAEYARWRRLSSQFSFLVNELYPESLKLDADYWPARYESGRLFLEKYNDPQAMRELKAALAINPNSAEAHAALAALALHDYKLDEARRELDRAQEINPELVITQQLRADMHLTNLETAEAIAVLEKARELNPVDEETLGRLAAVYAVVDGLLPDEPPSQRVAALIEQVNSRNPHAGKFYYALGAALDLARRFPIAAVYYREAVVRLPQMTEPRGALGLMYMRLGNEAEAKKLLDESFDVDPFNVRVANSVKVLEVLDGYAVLETEHFVLKFDRGQEELLARYASAYLEDEVYPTLVKQFGFEPTEKSLFEIFSRARNSDAHTWFSARMVGLPFVSTVGACAGKVVALTSPRELGKKFNWARVLKHEFVHVLNLQQTDFNVPHWFTEALAVEVEGHARPPEWNVLLAERVPKGELFNLDTINLGFVRPATSNDWQMAYCQAQLYAQFMLKTYGDDALAKMLACYADNLDSRAALRRSFDVDQAAFEAGYLAHVRQVAADLKPREGADRLAFDDAQKEVAAADSDEQRLAELAGVIEESAEAEPHDVRWPKLLARIYLKGGDDVRLAEALKKLADSDPDNVLVRKKLAQLALTAKNFAAAERWAREAVHADLWDADAHRFWGQALAGQEQYAAAMTELEVAVQLDPDNNEAKDALADARRLAEKPAQ
ncbi:MAG TPA: tetratricopeptide repeat protein [Pirellulales bacterium]|nr:tetratricopeptide repeat protein [Pirellulales bacterium]